MSGDASTVSSQQCVGGDDPAGALWSGECGGDRAEQCPVIVGEGWPVGLAAEYTVLVAQHDDLEVFAVSGTDGEAGQGGDEAVQNLVHGPSGSVDVASGQHPQPNIRPPQGARSGVLVDIML